VPISSEWEAGAGGFLAGLAARAVMARLLRWRHRMLRIDWHLSFDPDADR
jgi:hypothetical protein